MHVSTAQFYESAKETPHIGTLTRRVLLLLRGDSRRAVKNTAQVILDSDLKLIQT